jgi:hypothetical protein
VCGRKRFPTFRPVIYLFLPLFLPSEIATCIRPIGVFVINYTIDHKRITSRTTSKECRPCRPCHSLATLPPQAQVGPCLLLFPIFHAGHVFLAPKQQSTAKHMPRIKNIHADGPVNPVPDCFPMSTQRFGTCYLFREAISSTQQTLPFHQPAQCRCTYI